MPKTKQNKETKTNKTKQQKQSTINKTKQNKIKTKTKQNKKQQCLEVIITDVLYLIDINNVL